MADNAYNMYKTGELLDAENREDEPIMVLEEHYEDAILKMMADRQFYSDLISNVTQKYAQRNSDIHMEQGIRLTLCATTIIEEVRQL